MIYFGKKNKVLDRCLNKWIFSFSFLKSPLSLEASSYVLLGWFGCLGFFSSHVGLKKPKFFSFTILELWVSTSNPLTSLPVLACFLV